MPKKSIGGKLFFLIKFSIFYQKNNFPPKTSLRTPFERSDERESRHQAKGMENSAL